VSRARLYVVVALAGAAVLMLEILGTRVLGPFYGVSLFLWSALISVTLAALATGYALGGRWAGHAPRASRLSWLLAGAGAWVLLVPWTRGPLIAMASLAGLRAAVLIAALLLFFPPLMLLGMVSPYAIRIMTRSVDEVGRVSGDLFAISTVASVGAALLTGFVLVPLLGVSRLLFAVGLLLLVAAAIARLGSGGVLAWLAILAGAALAVPGLSRVERAPNGVLARTESPYAELRVVEHGGLRLFMIDGGIHSMINAETEAPHQPYVYVAELGLDAFPRPGRALLLGLGGGGWAGVAARHGWAVDAVEIDPQVPKVAADWFYLKPGHAHVIVEDARRYLRRSDASYEVILFDAFGSSSIPFHLVTRECFAEAKARLAPGGVMMVNVETIGWQDPLAHALFATLSTQFAHVWALPTAEPPNQFGNVVLMASDRDLDFTAEQLGDPVATLSDEDDHFRVVSRMHGWYNRYAPRRGRVLTDDWNPVDLRAEAINRASRESVRRAVPVALLPN
jgi:spermidine synthase